MTNSSSLTPRDAPSDELHMLRRLVAAYQEGGKLSSWLGIGAARQQARDNGRLVIMERALQSIAHNTCCQGCQEAARVAAKALDEEMAFFNERGEANHE